jgi:predicted MFS family arabinose efflux permease
MGALSRSAAWAPLRQRAFRIVWLTFLGVQVARWSQTVGAVAVIAAQSRSSLLLALVQTASTLPAVVFALPAGAAADMIDRRRLLLGLIGGTAVGIGALGLLVGVDAATPWVVLALTLLVGATIAVAVPAFAALVQDLVPREQIASAVTLNGISVNLARAVGPAMAGLILILVGAGVLFALLAAALVAMAVLFMTAPKPHAPPPSTGERLGAAMLAGVRFSRSSTELKAVLARSFVFVVPASAMWALLPAVTVQLLHLDAAAFGGVLAALGVGAVLGAQVLPQLRARYGLNLLMALGSAASAANLVVLGLVHQTVVVVISIVFAGAAWMAVLSSLQTSAQLVAPARVRGRVLSIYQLVFQGGMAAGSALWGVIAEAVGLRQALVASAAVLLVSLLGMRRWRLPVHAVAQGAEPAESIEAAG